jgi:uncharacterized protein
MNPLLQQAQRQGLDRRAFLRNLLFTAGSVSAAGWLTACGNSRPLPGSLGTDPLNPGRRSPFADIGPLLAPDANGVQLPAGFSSRVIAVVNEPPIPGNPTFLWHSDPDGGAVFRTEDGGWIYVSNSEFRDTTTGGAVGNIPGTSREAAELLGLFRGGVSALRFDAQGNLVDAYPVQCNTTTNCSGGPTPWGTWINGEEIVDGYMFECSPLRDGGTPIRLDRFGRKGHEMVALDVDGRAIYHTEDAGGDDRFYRTVFSPEAWPTGGRPDYSQGVLQVLAVDAGLDAARAGPVPTRWINAVDDGRPQRQVYLPESTIFSGNEGCWFLEGFVFFSTKSDDNIWAIDTLSGTIESIYNPEDGPVGSPVDPTEPQLAGVDNITMTLDGEMIVVEDGGDMRAMVLLPDRSTIPLLRLPGSPDVTEVTGAAFSPDGRRLYVANQRALRMGAPASFGTGGVVYEITLPFAVRVDPPMAGRMAD